MFAIYAAGCRELLPFFPATSLLWLKTQRDGKDSNWHKDWEDTGHNPAPESLNAYVDLAWRDCDPFNHRFEILAGQIYGPMLEHADADVGDEA